MTTELSFGVEPTRSSCVFIMAASVYDCLAITAVSSGSTCSLIRVLRGMAHQTGQTLNRTGSMALQTAQTLKRRSIGSQTGQSLKRTMNMTLQTLQDLKRRSMGSQTGQSLKRKRNMYFFLKEERKSKPSWSQACKRKANGEQIE